MRVLHVSFVGDLSKGLRAQLAYEYRASRHLNPGIEWETLVFHNDKPREAFERQLPIWARNVFLRKMFAWFFLIGNASNYDFLLQRYVVFDPFSPLFSRFVKNRITVHHSKEIDELRLIRSGWKGVFASGIEKWLGAVGLKHVFAIAGVTKEIANYEVLRIGRPKATLLFPNGIDMADVRLLENAKENDAINIAFVCSTFTPWHGLDRVLHDIKEWKGSEKVTFHLIGRVGQKDASLIEVINRSDCNVRIMIHGYLERDEFMSVLSGCDIGLGSFGMDRQGLAEGCTLKVREYLGMGLPVYSGHRDSALPEDFPFYKNSQFKMNKVVSFSLRMKSLEREEVRNLAKKYIEKRSVLEDLVGQVSDLHKCEE